MGPLHSGSDGKEMEKKLVISAWNSEGPGDTKPRINVTLSVEQKNAE